MVIKVRMVEADFNNKGTYDRYIELDNGSSLTYLTVPELFQISFEKPLPKDIDINPIGYSPIIVYNDV